MVHQLSRFSSQNPFRKNRGRVTCTSFHPTKPWFLVATQNNVRIYNLAKQTLIKKLLAGGGVVTSISVHSSGDHVLLGTEDNRCLWCAPSRSFAGRAQPLQMFQPAAPCPRAGACRSVHPDL